MKKSRIKWLAMLLVGLMISAFAVGCGTTTTQAPAPTPTPPAAAPTAPAVTIQQVADEYYANLGADNNMISQADLKAKIDAGDTSFLLVDIRSAEDYAKSHIKGAVNIPFAKLGEYLDKMPADKDIVIYCASGQTAAQTVAIMDMYGLKVKSLNLGFNVGWVGQNNFPVDTALVEFKPATNVAKPDPAIAKLLTDYYTNMPQDVHKLNSKDLQAKIDKGDPMQIFDLRSAEDFAKGHIKGAINIPFKEVNKHFNEFAKDKPVYVYCYSGQTAGQTAAVLNLLGINAYTLHGGWNLGWMADKMPVTQ